MPTANPRYFDPTWIQQDARTLSADIAIYGGTAAGVGAALVGRRAGFSVLLIHPGTTLGGMSTGGLSYTDFGNKRSIGGLSRSFYQDMGKHYGRAEEWKFEPHVAQQIIDQWERELTGAVERKQFLDRVSVVAGRIEEIRMLSGLIVRAKIFLDATYEGDLLASAGVSFATGREDNSVYNETWNGSQCNEKAGHQFEVPVSPYVVDGDASSGLLPGIEPNDAGPNGKGDQRMQAYNFRVCMTDDPSTRVPFPIPAGYDARHYELTRRFVASTPHSIFSKFDRLCVSHKTDTNNHGAVSTDFIGGNFTWLSAGYAEREAIFQRHLQYQQGQHYFLANDPGVPDHIRSAYAKWGLPRDEFAETNHWPHQLYVREGRRLVGDYVITEDDCMSRRLCDDSVGMGAYNMDSHNARRVVRDGRVLNEGNVEQPLPKPYRISYRALLPKRRECLNLIVPVCVSASHIAYGSVRMEPVFIALAESAILAASIALRDGVRLHDVPYPKLEALLVKAKQAINVDVKNDGHGNP